MRSLRILIVRKTAFNAAHLFDWDSRRRPLERDFGLVTIHLRHVDQVATGKLRQVLPSGGYIYRLEHSKTQQSGPSAKSTPDKPLLGRAADALIAWLNAANVHEGALFRRLWQNSRVGPALSPAAVAGIVRQRAALAGVAGDFGGHSLRSGFVTEGARQGVALPALMAMTDHRSVASVMGYFRSGAAAENPAANLLED